MNGTTTTLADSAGVDRILDGDTTPAEARSPVAAVAASRAELDSARLKEITNQLADDVRPLVARLSPVLGHAHPLVARARRWADVMLPIVDELRPLWDDLRPVVQDARALLGELFALIGIAAARLAQRLDLGPLMSVGRIAGTSARRVASVRPTLPTAGPSRSVPRVTRAPQLTPLRAPSIGIGAALRSIARRRRPGRWAFRTIAIGLIVLVVSDPFMRDAMVDEVNWTRSVLQTIEIPAIQVPNIELPAIQIPTFEIPTFEIPTILFPRQESAAPAKLTPAQFELPPLNAYRAAFETQASYPTVPPNATVEWVVALRNTGSAGWYRGVAGAQASLALTDGTEVAVQTTAYVAPGQVGWFIAHFRAPVGSGTHAVALFPRIDGRGELPDLGIHALVTVR